MFWSFDSNGLSETITDYDSAIDFHHSVTEFALFFAGFSQGYRRIFADGIGFVPSLIKESSELFLNDWLKAQRPITLASMEEGDRKKRTFRKSAERAIASIRTYRMTHCPGLLKVFGS